VAYVTGARNTDLGSQVLLQQVCHYLCNPARKRLTCEIKTIVILCIRVKGWQESLLVRHFMAKQTVAIKHTKTLSLYCLLYLDRGVCVSVLVTVDFFANTHDADCSGHRALILIEIPTGDHAPAG
jgi:hypothetical protein